ncbi:hypothetical protein [Scytonema sp. HK-05]|uniref:hypothetical protein n=1 Tax=Scytonema sp. HK-05 TaxID=1137095 RepID=UPI0011613508|nr:hypothetical protein [Scytonema sp. HK-05]
MIISPILLDLRRQLNDQINLFSGVEFNVEPAQGLNGICDFIITHSPERLIVTAPVSPFGEVTHSRIHAFKSKNPINKFRGLSQRTP